MKKLTKQEQQTPEYRAQYAKNPPPFEMDFDTKQFDFMDFNSNEDGWFDLCLVDMDNTPDSQWISHEQRITWRYRHYPPTALYFDNAYLTCCDFCGGPDEYDAKGMLMIY